MCFLLASLFLISTSSIFSSKTLWQESLSDPWISNVWYEGMAHTVLIVCWLYYKENSNKARCFVWIAALLIVGAGVTYAYVSKSSQVSHQRRSLLLCTFTIHLTCLVKTPTNHLEHRLFRRTDVTRRHDSVLEFNEKRDDDEQQEEEKTAESKSDSTGEVRTI